MTDHIEIRNIQQTPKIISVELETPSQNTKYQCKNTEDAHKTRVIDGRKAPKFIHRALSHAQQKHRENQEQTQKPKKQSYEDYEDTSYELDIREGGKPNT